MSLKLDDGVREKAFFGHPRGLATLFMTEMWERFSFYGLRAILVLFLVASPAVGGLGLTDQTATALVGIYGAFVYLVALPGGWIADRILGARRSVLVGGTVIMCGHICMAIPAEGSGFVWLGLALIIVGTGLLKPSMPTMVGRLYRDDDAARRDSGFSIFYLGVNIGAFAAPYVVGTLADGDRWHLGFGAAAVGMAFGLAQYVRGARHLGDAGTRPGHRLTPQECHRFIRIALVSAAAVFVALAGWAASGTFTLDRLTAALTVVIVLVPVAYFAYMLLGSHDLTPDERSRLKAYIWLFIAAAIFWMIYDLAPSVLNLFAEKRTDLALFGIHIHASTTQSFNPLFIMIFVPVFAWLWVRLGDRVSVAQKFAFALVVIGVSFVVMSLAAAQSGKISIWWLVAVYLIQVFGELSISPVGLSVTTSLAPHAFRSQMLGVWYLSFAVGDAVGGQTLRLRSHLSEPTYYLLLALIAIAAGLALLAANSSLRALTQPHGHDQGREHGDASSGPTVQP
jgi:POT family proton-dependent oligopeptide transporter